MARFQCTFQNNWKSKFNWISEVPGDKRSAFCKLCQTKVFLSNMGITALKSHQKGKKHQLKVKSASSSELVNNFFTIKNSSPVIHIDPANISAEPAINTTIELNKIDLNNKSCVNKLDKNSCNIEKYNLKEDVIKAELMWCIHSVMTHKSLRSGEKDVKCFPEMFPDSAIAKNIQLGRDKMAYLIVYGISPYFQQQLVDEISTTKFFVLGFDESLNKVSQKQQMDIIIRYWCEIDSEVKTRYFTSVFLGRTRACDMLESFTEATKSLDINKKLLQLSMDGPNVNKKFIKDVQNQIKDETGAHDHQELLNIGSCGLHTVNVAFKIGVISTKWKIFEFLRALYYLFKDSPARRSLYTFYSGSELFPLKFCSIRWLENSRVAQRALEILPYVTDFIKGVETNKEIPTSKSYEIVKSAISDSLLPSKLTFFQTISNEMEGFLREYQTDIPLIPFLFNDLSVLMRGLMERFIKKELVQEKDLMHIDVSDKNNIQFSKKIDVGIATESSLRKAKISGKDVILFKQECCQFLKKTTAKIQERSPLAYALTKAASCFDPAVASNDKVFSKRLTQLLLIFTEKNWITGIVAENVKREFKDICTGSHAAVCLQKYKRSERVDKFWLKIFQKEGASSDLLQLLKLEMSLAHGNASVERGFSINSDCLWENMKEGSLIARRRVYDTIASSGGIGNIGLHISKQLIMFAKNARMRYSEAMEARRKEQASKRESLKRKKEVEIQMKLLENKKKKILEVAEKERTVIEEEIAALSSIRKKL